MLPQIISSLPSTSWLSSLFADRPPGMTGAVYQIFYGSSRIHKHIQKCPPPVFPLRRVYISQNIWEVYDERDWILQILGMGKYR